MAPPSINPRAAKKYSNWKALVESYSDGCAPGYAYTDGSSRGNGTPSCVAGWAFVTKIGRQSGGGIVYVRYGSVHPSGFITPSNNVGEIVGVLFGLCISHITSGIHFQSDSQYVVNSVSKWRKSQMREAASIENNRRLLPDPNAPIERCVRFKNAQLLLPVYNLWEGHGRHHISWVRGHDGHHGNEIADIFAGIGVDGFEVNERTHEYNIRRVQESELWTTMNKALALLKGKTST